MREESCSVEEAEEALASGILLPVCAATGEDRRMSPTGKIRKILLIVTNLICDSFLYDEGLRTWLRTVSTGKLSALL
jgi:hypothetical protein